jgi:hypothetical protein
MGPEPKGKPRQSRAEPLETTGYNPDLKPAQLHFWRVFCYMAVGPAHRFGAKACTSRTKTSLMDILLQQIINGLVLAAYATPLNNQCDAVNDQFAHGLS